ncbi:MAG: hypothetical protein H6580_05440 [Flammeovirgaceae bacterium]|nr:hypothetical protein [Flammeovirgaceae bacterium]
MAGSGVFQGFVFLTIFMQVDSDERVGLDIPLRSIFKPSWPATSHAPTVVGKAENFHRGQLLARRQRFTHADISDDYLTTGKIQLPWQSSARTIFKAQSANFLAV